VDRKNSIPILSNVLAEAAGGELRICATDLDVSMRCGCAARVGSEGAITLGAKKLYEIVRSLPDTDVRIRVLPDSWVAIDCEKVSFKMAGLPREDFPALPQGGARGGIEVPGEALRDLIGRTAFAITAEDARYYLAGALLLLDAGGVAMVATDGHRLSYARRETPLKLKEPQRVLVPRKALHEMARLLEQEETVAFEQLENHLVFTIGERSLASKMIEGQFPAFEKVITVSGDVKLSLPREELATAIRRVSLLSSERSRAVRLRFHDGCLEIAASSPDLGEAREEMEAAYEGQGLDVGFNAQYLLDFLAVAGGDSVLVELKDPDSQGLFRPADGGPTDHRYVVMPIRL
jgi:DNA polymerase-3 subunit beta